MKFVKFLIVSLGLCICDCGRTRMDPKVQGGYDITDIKEWPFIGYFSVMMTPTRIRICSAILVDPLAAITAGHCVLVDEDARTYQLLPLTELKPTLVMGVANYTHVHDPFYQRRDIKQLFIHPKARYNGDGPVSDRYDIGAMKWTEKVTLNMKIQLVPLIPEKLIPFQAFRDIIKQGGRCESAGWGQLEVHWRNPTKKVPVPDILQGFHTDIISILDCCMVYHRFAYQKCLQELGEGVTGYFCHIRRKMNTSAANGDSGSPIYCNYKGKKYVVGMNVCGDGSLDPPPNGPIEVLVPAYFAIDAVLRPYISNITGSNTSGMTNSSEKTTAGQLFVQILAVLSRLLRR